MKNLLIKIILFLSIAFSATFTTKDPPMIYIYHLGNHDISDSTHINNQLLLSAIVTSSVASFDQIKIAGESLQGRIKDDNFLNLFKSSKYPENTDYILIEEINSMGNQYEIDLKILDVSTQDVISSEFLSLQENLFVLRQLIEYKIQNTLTNLLKPFSGNIFIRVDQSSKDKIRWDYIAIRPAQTLAQGQIIKTTDKDFKIYNVLRKEFGTAALNSRYGGILKKENKPDLLTEFFSDYTDLITEKDLNNLGLFVDDSGNPKIFLEGEYIIRAYIKNNENWFETKTTVSPGEISEVHLILPYTIPPVKPPPPPPPTGTIVINNMQDGIESVLRQNLSQKMIVFTQQKGKINIISIPYADISYSDNSIIFENLPLGNYTLFSNALSTSTFPGKHFTNIFEFKEDVSLKRNKGKKEIKLPPINKQSGKEVVIYLHPFIPTQYEEYLLYKDGSNIPFSRIKNAGEVHVIGVDPAYNGKFIIHRAGFKNASVKITSGNNKVYALANLSKK